MSTSRETQDLDNETLRSLIDQANAMSLLDRITLLKGLIPGVAREMSPSEFAAVSRELALKGERLHEAMSEPGRGRATRQIAGERELEERY